LHVTLEKVGHYRLEGGSKALSADTIRRATRVAGLTVASFVLTAVLFSLIFAVCLILLGRHSTILL
jgi:cobalamin biosynthesis protein CobD/CbiB